jgi:hypothetical protein
MRTLAGVGHDVWDAITGAQNDPWAVANGGRKGFANFGPELFNGTVNTLKTSLNGYSLIAEKVGLGDGALTGFRESDPYNITPLYAYNNKTEAGAAFLTNLAMGGAAAKYGAYAIELDAGVGVASANSLGIRLRAPAEFNPDVYVIRYDPQFPGRPDPKFSIDTNSFVNPRDYNSAGFPRDAGLFWKQWIDLNPESISSSNRYLIENYEGLKVSPRIDQTWIQSFPEQSSYFGDVLYHHHVDHGQYAIPVPRTTHRGSGGPWHY